MTIVQNPKSSVIKKLKILKDIDQKTREELAKKGQIFTLTSKKNYLKELPIEDKAYFLIEGRAFLSCIEPDGRKMIMENLFKGDFFGDLGFREEEKLAPPPLETNCIFLEPLPKEEIQILVLSKKDFLQILSTSPCLMTKVLSSAVWRINQLEQKLEEIAFFGLETKILTELVKLGDIEPGEEAIVKVNSKITHEKLAQSTGSVRETVSRAISKLKRTGLIFHDRQKHLIVRLFKIKSLS